MPLAPCLDALSVYGARAVRVVPREGPPAEAVSAGGDLEASWERLGARPALEVLGDPAVAELLLQDGELAVRLRREGSGARLVVSWATDTVVDEAIEIPPPGPVIQGPAFRPEPGARVTDVVAALHDPATALYAVDGGWYTAGLHGRGAGERPLLGSVAPLLPGALGAASFRATHRARLAYVVGAMAGGIASVEIVRAATRGGLVAFFGSGGLPLPAVEAALAALRDEPGPWGMNLLHNPLEPDVEEKTVDLYLAAGVRRIEASAYMDLTPAVVRFRLHGIRREGERVVAPNAVFAKISRTEVAERFLRPAPEKMLRELVAAGALTAEQAELARHVPVACDVTAEADSGGHTDRRPLVVLFPEIARLRDRIAAEQGYAERPRVGAAGGLGTPQAVWAALAMGADYVLTGSVNQATVEAGTSELAKQMLCEAAFADVASGPAPDMFELGAEVQVLARGSMYTQRAGRLYEIYRAYPSMEAIPAEERAKIEKQIFRRPLDEVWAETEAYWAGRDPRQVERARAEPRHQMALTFRWYLGMTSRWARMGTEDRKRDFQMWCGPAMGGFNAWVRGTRLEPLAARTVVGVADALMSGAAACARVSSARLQGLALPEDVDGVGVG